MSAQGMAAPMGQAGEDSRSQLGTVSTEQMEDGEAALSTPTPASYRKARMISELWIPLTHPVILQQLPPSCESYTVLNLHHLKPVNQEGKTWQQRQWSEP